MRKEKRRLLGTAAGLLGSFILWTAAVDRIDVGPIGPQGSSVGFAALNDWFHNLTGVHMALYTVTDFLGLVPLGVAAGFGLWGLAQWIGRKDIRRGDRELLLLGAFYAAVIAVYGFFEIVVINYRPVLIEGVLEASYPSSTTLLTMCVMPTAVIQLRRRIENAVYRCCITGIAAAFVVFMVVGRLLSGVHWITDIIGGALFSVGAVFLYAAVSDLK